MPATMQSITAITKERYQGSLRKQLDQETVALQRITKTNDGVTSEVGGKYVTFPIHVSRNSGIGARGEIERLPRPGQQGTRAVRIGLKYLYGGMQLSGQALALANSNPEAFISALELETQGLKDDVAKDLNRQVYGNSTGVFATVTGAAAGNVVPVSSTQYFQIDMMVDIMDSTSTVDTPVLNLSNRQIISIDEDNSTVTISGPAPSGLAAGDMFTRFGNYNREWTGFASLFDDTSPLFDVDPATEPVWKSYVGDNGGTDRSISETLLLATVNEVKRRGGKITAIFTSPGVWLSYFNLLQQQRQYVNTKEFAGGYSGLTFITPDGEVPVVQDFDAPPGTAYGVNEKDLKVYREADWSFMDRDGSMWERVPGYDAYEAMLFQYSELGIGRRNSHFVLKDLTETTV